MTDTSADQERKERMSKALGAAFLSHQVHQLEQSVDQLSFSRNAPPHFHSHGNHHSDSRGRGGRSRGRGRGQVHHAQHPRGHAHQHHKHENFVDAEMKTRSMQNQAGPRHSVLVDASVLVHALPVVKKWVREGSRQVIVPLQALSTLDVLKRAPQPLRDQAKEATKFLENHLQIAREIQARLGDSPEAKRRIRLRSQKPEEETDAQILEKAFKIPSEMFPRVDEDEREESAADTEGNSGDSSNFREAHEFASLPSLQQISKPIQSILRCALHFKIAGDALNSVNLVVYNTMHPPTPVSAAPVFAHHQPDGSAPVAPAPPDYLALCSGDTLSHLVQTYYPTLTLEISSAAELLAAKKWLKLEAEQKKIHSESTRGHSSRKGTGHGVQAPNGSSTTPARTLFVP